MLFIRGVLFTSSVNTKPPPAVQLIKMSTYLCIFSLLSTVSSLDPLETLLQSPISEARCLAACLMLPSAGSRAQCLQVCRFRQQHPDTDLCRVPGLCVDLGCQVACQDITLLPHTGMFTSFTRSGCRLSWSVGEMMEGANVVFVVAGQDYSAMWSLVAANITEDHVELEPGLGHRIRSLAVIAVSMSGVEDILHVRIPHNLGCPHTLETVSQVSSFWSGLETWQLAAVISLSVLVSALFVIMLLVICCGRKKTPTLTYLEHKGRRSISSNVKGKSEKFNNIGHNSILENSYVTLPSSASSSATSIDYLENC